MKKSEKIISALLLMALGVTFIILKDNFIGILMTVAGVSLIVLGLVDIFDRTVPPAVVKIVTGLLLVIAGWAIVEAVLYILSGILLTFGILLLYDKIKNHAPCHSLWREILEYALPALCVAIGILLLFHQSAAVNFVFILCGSLTVVEGIAMLLLAFIDE